MLDYSKYFEPLRKLLTERKSITLPEMQLKLGLTYSGVCELSRYAVAVGLIRPDGDRLLLCAEEGSLSEEDIDIIIDRLEYDEARLLEFMLLRGATSQKRLCEVVDEIAVPHRDAEKLCEILSARRLILCFGEECFMLLPPDDSRRLLLRLETVIEDLLSLHYERHSKKKAEDGDSGDNEEDDDLSFESFLGRFYENKDDDGNVRLDRYSSSFEIPFGERSVNCELESMRRRALVYPHLEEDDGEDDGDE